ncbi:hypothetical protein B0H21DRAFT_765663 [Amylocystis lapponica]|nr:hypothetical protein B0H21DRAFT_765663 [Amylocystis lapponica]
MYESQSADSMLAEIQAESLQHLLGAVRWESSSLGSTKIPALDAHLLSVQTMQRPALNRGDVFEIQGPAASGKSHLLFYLIMTCIMPSSAGSIALGGWDKAAILFDTDGTFDVRRFHMLLASRLSRLLPQDLLAAEPETAVTPEALATHCLANLHIFRPTSSLQLAVTLLHLPAYHATNLDLQSTEIGLLAIDSISAFYWQDRFTVEQMQGTKQSHPESKASPPGPANPLRHVLTALQRFRISHGPVIILTNWGLNPLEKPTSTGESLSPFYKQHLHPFPSPFERRNSFGAYSVPSSPSAVNPRPQSSRAAEISQANRPLTLTHHITLTSPPAISFDPSLTLDKTIQEEPLRLAAVKERGVTALIRTPGTPKPGKFSIFITEREIVVDCDVSSP